MVIRKPAETRVPIHELLRERWSPRAFADRSLDLETVQTLFEAARWSASCFNEQPWRFIVALRDQTEAFERLSLCLNESNRRWAPRAAMLMLTCAHTQFAADGSTNRMAMHDIGLAVQNMTVQASALGLVVHQIAGILPDVARTTYAIPSEYEILTIVAVGYQGELEDLNPYYHEREQRPRTRKSLSEIVFFDGWEQPAPFTHDE